MSESFRLPRKSAAVAVAALLLAVARLAVAWDGAVTATIAAVEITGGTNYGFRVMLSGVTSMCTGGSSSWAFLNETDSNYKTYVAALMMAKSQGNTVTIYSTLEGGYCHIGYVSVQ